MSNRTKLELGINGQTKLEDNEFVAWLKEHYPSVKGKSDMGVVRAWLETEKGYEADKHCVASAELACLRCIIEHFFHYVYFADYKEFDFNELFILDPTRPKNNVLSCYHSGNQWALQVAETPKLVELHNEKYGHELLGGWYKDNVFITISEEGVVSTAFQTIIGSKRICKVDVNTIPRV